MSQSQPINSYRDLKVWQNGMQFTVDIYKLTQGFPKEELYGLTSQIRRAAASVPANIAEGHARASTKEYLRHLSIAIGSLAEVATFLELAYRLQYSGKEEMRRLAETMAEQRRMLRGLQRSLRSKLKLDSP